jgi:uncharacterized protein (TIGR00369 family)
VTPNPDHAALHAFLRDPTPRPICTSPLLEALGATLEYWEDGRLSMGFAPQPLFRQGAGVVQGGALAAMLDFAMAFRGMAAAGADRSVATTSMTTNFLAAATGSGFSALGEIEKAGRRVIHARARLDCDGRPVATASSTLLVL